MPNTSIRLTQGFMSLSKVSEQVYCQCFVDQGIHADYARLLQQEIAKVCLWSGEPALQSQIEANNNAFVIVDKRYVVFQDGLLIQFGLTILSNSAPTQNKHLTGDKGIMPPLNSPVDLTAVPDKE